MIPEYLKGKSATQIVDEQREQFIAQSYHCTDDRIKDRINQLETFVLLSVTYALDMIDNEYEIGQIPFKDAKTRIAQAEGRAIAFLNMVLPKETK